MVHETIQTYTKNGAEIRIGFDSGGPVGGDYFARITGDEWAVTRFFFFDTYNERYARNFAEKVATDAAYRERSIHGEAEWAQVSDTYLTGASVVLTAFETQGLLSHTVGDDAERKRHHDAADEMRSVCKDLFTGVRERIRDDGHSPDDDEVKEFVKQKIHEGRDKASQLANSNRV